MPRAPDSTNWTARLGEALEHSVEQAEKAMTGHPDVQAWLRRASLEAGMAAGTGGGIDAMSTAYGYLLDDLRQRFPALARAVDELTGGCARLDVHWRPLSPAYTRLRLDFGTDFRVHAFRRPGALDEAAACEALEAVARELPRGMPFAGHPNEANGVVAHGGRCVAVRFRETRSDGGRQRTVSLHADGQPTAEGLAPEDAARALLQLLSSSSGTGWIDTQR